MIKPTVEFFTGNDGRPWVRVTETTPDLRRTKTWEMSLDQFRNYAVRSTDQPTTAGRHS